MQILQPVRCSRKIRLTGFFCLLYFLFTQAPHKERPIQWIFYTTNSDTYVKIHRNISTDCKKVCTTVAQIRKKSTYLSNVRIVVNSHLTGIVCERNARRVRALWLSLKRLTQTQNEEPETGRLLFLLLFQLPGVQYSPCLTEFCFVCLHKTAETTFVKCRLQKFGNKTLKCHRNITVHYILWWSL